MAYRRRQGMNRSATFNEDIYRRPPQDHDDSSSLAAQAIKAAAHRRSSFHYSFKDSTSKGAPPPTYHSTSNEGGSFWGVLARKAKAILDDDILPHQHHPYPTASDPQFYDQPCQTAEGSTNVRKGLDALTSSLNHLGDTLGNALEEGRYIVESKTADIIEETRKLQIRRKGINSDEQNQEPSWQQSTDQQAQPLMQTHQEDQLKASRDVAKATAAKAKLLFRELKAVKADLAFAKQRCSQLEEENRILREARDKGDNPADDDMIRLQLETLLAEKARLAHENSVYARENRFLREIVEYHQLTTQDVVYLDEGIEEITEVYPITAASRMLSVSPSPTPPEGSPSRCIPIAKELLTDSVPQKVEADVSRNETLTELQ